jgi:hypothetical protein
MIGYPPTWDFLKIVEHNLIPNCPIGCSDILAAEDIFGLNVDSLKGKMVRHGEQHVPSNNLPILRDILSLYHIHKGALREAQLAQEPGKTQKTFTLPIVARQMSG